MSNRDESDDAGASASERRLLGHSSAEEEKPPSTTVAPVGQHGAPYGSNGNGARAAKPQSLVDDEDELDEEAPLSARARMPVREQYPAVQPGRVESRLSVGEGGLQLSDDDLSEHPLAEAAAEDLSTLHGDAAQHGRRGNALPGDFTSDSDMVEMHEPVAGSESEVEVGGSAVPAEAAEKKKEVKPPFGWPTAKEFPRFYFKRLTGYDQSLDVFGFYPSLDQIAAFVFTCTTLVVLGLINHYGFHPLVNHTISAFIPAFGASCTVVYAVPKAPIAQPRNVVFAHVSAAVIGTAFANAFRNVAEEPFGQHCAGAVGVAIHLALMMVTNTMHPPASATVVSAAINPLNSYYQDQGFLFCLTPVLFGSLVVVIMAWLLNNLIESRGPYPQYW